MQRAEKDGTLEAMVLETQGFSWSNGKFGVGDNFTRRGNSVFGEVYTCDTNSG